MLQNPVLTLWRARTLLLKVREMIGPRGAQQSGGFLHPPVVITIDARDKLRHRFICRAGL
jgi:hypothetical protein